MSEVIRVVLEIGGAGASAVAAERWDRPWRVDLHFDDDAGVQPEPRTGGDPVDVIDGEGYPLTLEPFDDQDARRIVACVNFFRAMTTAEIEGCTALLEQERAASRAVALKASL